MEQLIQTKVGRWPWEPAIRSRSSQHALVRSCCYRVENFLIFSWSWGGWGVIFLDVMFTIFAAAIHFITLSCLFGDRRSKSSLLSYTFFCSKRANLSFALGSKWWWIILFTSAVSRFTTMMTGFNLRFLRKFDIKFLHNTDEYVKMGMISPERMINKFYKIVTST